VTTRPLQQRIAARLLLACCTLAIGLGLGTAIAVVGVLDLQDQGEPFSAYLAAVGRGLVPALILTVLAAVLAARALLAARRLRAQEGR